MRNGLKWISGLLIYMLLIFAWCIAPAHASVLHDDAFVGKWKLVPDEWNEEGELILALDGTGTMCCNTDHLFHGQNWELFWDSGNGLTIEVVEDSSGYTNDVSRELFESRGGRASVTQGGVFAITGCSFKFDYDASANSIIFCDCCGDLHRFEYDDSWKTEAIENIPMAWRIEIGDPQDYDYGYFFLNADGSGQCELRATMYEGDELVEKVLWYSPFSWEVRMTGFEMKLERGFSEAYLEKGKVYTVELNGFAGFHIEDTDNIKTAEIAGDYGDIHMYAVEATPSEVEPIPSYESERNKNLNIEYMADKTEFSVGDRVYLGKYEQDNDSLNGAEDIQWRILAIEDGQALLLSEYILDGLYYDLDYMEYVKREAESGNGSLLSEYIPEGFDHFSENWGESLQSEYILDWLDEDIGYWYWKGSYVRAWLNEGFMGCAFSETEASNIQKNLCEDNKGSGNPNAATNNTMDWIFLLSEDEIERYMPIKEDRRALATSYALENGKASEQNNGYSYWWLRVAGRYEGESVGSEGHISHNSSQSRSGIRPAMWYKLPEGATVVEKDNYDSITQLEEESFAVGDTLNFGKYEQDYDLTNGSEPILWRILDINEDNVAMAISVNVLDSMAFIENSFGNQSLEKSELMEWLNEEFTLQAFTDEEMSYMRNFSWGDVRSSFKVGILLTSEVEQFMPALREGLEADTEYVQCEYGGNDGWWVYKDSGSKDKGSGLIVSYESGEIEYYSSSYRAGVRPLIRIRLNHSSEENGSMKEQQDAVNTEAAYEAQTTDSTDFQWEIREDNTVSLVRYTGRGYKISIPAEYNGLPVTEIADGAFEECSLVGEVVVPESVNRIGTKAFYKCNMLESVVLPAGEVEFGKFVFNNCPNVVLYVQAGSPAQAYAQGHTLEYRNK